MPGLDNIKGVVRYSSAHISARDFIEKKVYVVGTLSSGFNTVYKYARLGINVILLQRSLTYVINLMYSIPRMLRDYAPD